MGFGKNHVNPRLRRDGKLMPFTDVPILCFGFNQTAFVESTRSYGKVYENRQQRIATKIQRVYVEVIEAYPPPATKGNM
jgi:hypothetical protein